MKDSNKKKLIIVKVGTNVLTKLGEGRDELDEASFSSIGQQVRRLSDDGYGVILVSSGAITAGVLGEQKCREDICDIVEEQRYAARGWDTVVQTWKESIGADRISSTLLTKREITNETMRKKLLGVIDCCLSHGDIFIVNENDCLSDDEIKFGDNDMLAATLASKCKQSDIFDSVELILLTNKHGLNKVAEDDSTLIREVSNISSVEAYAGGAANGHSRGGMRTKIQAAKLATGSGVTTSIANGRQEDVVAMALSRSVGTVFKTQQG